MRNLRRRGYSIVAAHSTILDFTGLAVDLVEAWYASAGRPFVANVSLGRCRLGPSGARCRATSDHPCIRALHDYRLGKVTKDAYEAVQAYFGPGLPRNATEALQLPETAVHEALLRTPATDRIYPWDTWNTETERERWPAALRRDLRDHLNLVSQEDVDLAGRLNVPLWNLVEFRRCIAVYESIRRVGYRRSRDVDGDIEGTVLVSNDESVLLVYRGYHRMAALAALDYESAPVRVGGAGRQSVVRRDEVDRWPKVRDGLFTRQQALCVFDRIVRGE